jgi:hypothetical protein
MSKKHMKKLLTISDHKEMQIKTTLRFPLTPVRIITIKNTTPTNAGEDSGKNKPSYTAGGNVN